MRKRALVVVLLIVILFGCVVWNRRHHEALPGSLPKISGIRKPAIIDGKLVLPPRIKDHDCVIQDALPDPECTPGAVDPNVTPEQVCAAGYSEAVHDEVSEALKEQVYRAYNIPKGERGKWQVDHFISVGVGGADDISNLWIQRKDPRPGYHEKDRLETILHNRICGVGRYGPLTLAEAQLMEASNWVAAWQELPPPRRRRH